LGQLEVGHVLHQLLGPGQGFAHVTIANEAIDAQQPAFRAVFIGGLENPLQPGGAAVL